MMMMVMTIKTGPLSHLVSLSSHIVNVQNFEHFNGVYRPQVTSDSEDCYIPWKTIMQSMHSTAFNNILKTSS